MHVWGGQVLFDEIGFDEAAICIWSLACIRAMIAVERIGKTGHAFLSQTLSGSHSLSSDVSLSALPVRSLCSL